MPSYIVLYHEKKKDTGKPKTDTIFVPSIGDAWRLAPKQLPKGAKIVDIQREGENSRNKSGNWTDTD
jgi:hypothetical protein